MADGAELDLESLRDVRHSAAVSLLDQLRSQGLLSTQRYEFFLSKYKELHAAVLSSYENERKLLGTARELNENNQKARQELSEEFQTAKMDDEEIQKYRVELAQADTELNKCRRNFEQLAQETTSLVRQKTELQEEVEMAKQRKEEQYRPLLKKLEQEVGALREEHKNVVDKYTKVSEEVRGSTSRFDKLTVETDRRTHERSELQAEYARIENDPAKMKKQADIVDKALANIRDEYEQNERLYNDLDDTLHNQLKRKTEAAEERVRSQENIQKKKNLLHAQDMRNSELETDLLHFKEDYKATLAERGDLEMQEKDLRVEFHRERENLSRATKEKDKCIRQYRRLENQTQYNRAQNEKAVLQCGLMTKELEDLQRFKGSVSSELEEVKRDVDIQINNFLKQEGAEKSGGEAVKEIRKEVSHLEANVEGMKDMVHSLAHEISLLSSGREVQARDAARGKRVLKQMMDTIKMKSVEIVELEKQSAEVEGKLKQLLEDYSKIKSEKMKNASLIASAGMAASELKEKNSLLENEFDVLRRESLSKDKGLAKERSKYSQAFLKREALRQEVNGLASTYADRKLKIHEQLSRTERLNAIINQTEKDMLSVKRAYEQTVEDRNFTGIQVIDRNDELCILYEKLNVEESILKHGEITLQQREEELRVLHVEMKDLRRSLEVAHKNRQIVERLSNQVDELQEHLADEVEKVDILSKTLETPGAMERKWRDVGKNVEDNPEELKKRMNELEERINMRKEQVLEKDLMLEELNSVTGNLMKESGNSRGTTLEVAKQVNVYQSKIRNTTRKMMAAVAELSVYQAKANELGDARSSLDTAVTDAQERIARGEAPTDTADEEFEAMEAARERRSDELRAHHAHQEMLRSLPPTLTRTTAVPRPNAYIPDDELAIPKPYGGHAPFRPTPGGATMRHIRNPEPKEIVW